MANRILVYQDGQRLGIEGTANDQVLKWNSSSSAWELSSAGAGTVTSITAGSGLSGGTITSSGTIAADFGTTSGKIAEGNDSRFPPAPAAAGRLIYDTGTVWTALAAGTEGKVLTAHGAAAPTWETPTTGTVTSIATGTGLSGGTITSTGTISLANTTVAPATYGSTADKAVSFTVDAQGRLTSAGEQNIAIDASQVTAGTLAVARGGTGVSTIAAGGIMLGAGTSAITTKTLGAGELLIGSAVSGPDAATLTAGTGVAISNGNHSITIGIGQAVGTGESPTFVGATFSGLTANRFVYTNASKALTSLANGSGTLAGYDTTGDATAISLGSGLSMTGSTLSASGSGGTVTSISAGTGLSGGTITTTGTISMPNVGTASTYGSAAQIPVITTDAQGRVYSVTTAAVPYDIAGSVAGTPTVSVDCFYFIAVRACSILASGHRAKCKTAPSGTTTFTLNLNGASIGTIQFTVAGGTTGTVTITSGPVAVADGEEITLTAPANLNGLVDPRFTLKATVA